MKRILLACLVGLTLGCYRDNDPNLPPEEVVFGRGDCTAACTTLRRLGCVEGRPSPGGVPCERVCEVSAERLPVACVAGAESVEEVRGCGVRCQQ